MKRVDAFSGSLQTTSLLVSHLTVFDPGVTTAQLGH